MANYVDFQNIKATISIEQVLDMLGIKHLKPHGEVLRGACPICQVGNDRTFVATPAKNSFYCFSEKKGGDIIELAARFYRLPQKEGAQRIAKHFGLNGAAEPPPTEETAKPTPETPTSGFDPKAYQASLGPRAYRSEGLRVPGADHPRLRRRVLYAGPQQRSIGAAHP